MARGYLYEISNNKNKLGSTTAENISGIQEKMGLDSVHNDSTSNITRALVLKHLSEKCGATITKDLGIIFTKEAKKKYFEEKYQRFTSLAKKMTLEIFSTSSLYDLRDSIENNYGDIVFNTDEETWDTFDAFMRQAACDIPYYIGNIMIIK